MISIVPGYISRSVAGSYDNEGIAIFCMLLTYYLWIKAVKTGAILWSTMSALAYFYMVSSWGGYVFLINLIPLHVLALMLTGRFSHRIYVAFSILYCVGTILSMQISFVGFQPVQSSEHMLVSFELKRNEYNLLEWVEFLMMKLFLIGRVWNITDFTFLKILITVDQHCHCSLVRMIVRLVNDIFCFQFQALGVFGLCQIFAFIEYVRSRLSKENFDILFKALLVAVLSGAVVVAIILTITGKVSPWTGRFYSLLDPSYAKNHIPIIASVSEHQPTSWSSFYFDLQVSLQQNHFRKRLHCSSIDKRMTNIDLEVNRF